MTQTERAKIAAKLQWYGLDKLGYGGIPLTGNPVTDQLNIEFLAFRIGHTEAFGGLGRFGHMKKGVDLLWNNPALASTKRFIWNSWGERMHRRMCDTMELGIAGCASAGKCLGINELVLLANGDTKKAGDVKPGDLLMGDGGTPRTVLETHRGHGPMYRITPERGDPWECTGDHMQAVWVGSKRCVAIATKMLTCAGCIRNFRLKRYTPGGGVEFIGFRVTKTDVSGDWAGFSLDGNKLHLLADGTVTHNSDPAALYGVWSYIADPTHTMVIVMSTTLQGAKKRVWKTLREYWESIPGFPGKPLWSTNEIQGLRYDGQGYGQSSGIFLLASEQSNEKSALDKLIGIKAPRTGDCGFDYEELLGRPEYADLAKHFNDETLRDLLPRLQELAEARIGRLILIIDEATGCSESILNVINSNLKPGNSGRFQVIMLGNPNSHFDTFGLFCTPKAGWQSVTLDDEEWETATGGLCIRFNAEESPRIVEGNEKFSWMLSKEEIAKMEGKYGRNSLFFYRMALGMWSPEGTEAGVYSEADFLSTGAMDHAVWGFHKPKVLSTLDPSFSQGGDRASCTFFHFGVDAHGRQVLERREETAIKPDISDRNTPVSYQIVRQWRDECRKRGIGPEDAACDVTGAPSFGDIVRTQWSSLVLLVNSGGKASKTPLGSGEKNPDGSLVLCSERFGNKATQIWYGAMPFLRSGQIKGVTPELAREICARQHDKKRGDGRTLMVESKRVYKTRMGHSPDESDSFFLGIELAVKRHRFSSAERPAVATSPRGAGSWEEFKNRARRISSKPRNLNMSGS